VTSPLSSANPRTFEKFLVSADGTVVQRFGPRTEPEDPRVLEAIAGLLG